MNRLPAPKKEAGMPRWAALAAIGLMAGVAVLMWSKKAAFGPGREDIPALLPAYSDPATARKVRTEMTFNGAPCKSCHEGTEPLQGNPKEKGVFHDGIKLQHGRNQHCFNCHHRLQPANFANFDGTPIVLANIELLCARCHGTIYRDWNSGLHGRRTGFWDKSKGGPKPTVCIACHDPHWPVFKPMKSAPAPHVNPHARRRAQDDHSRLAGGHH